MPLVPYQAAHGRGDELFVVCYVLNISPPAK